MVYFFDDLHWTHSPILLGTIVNTIAICNFFNSLPLASEIYNLTFLVKIVTLQDFQFFPILTLIFVKKFLQVYHVRIRRDSQIGLKKSKSHIAFSKISLSLHICKFHLWLKLHSICNWKFPLICWHFCCVWLCDIFEIPDIALVFILLQATQISSCPSHFRRCLYQIYYQRWAILLTTDHHKGWGKG